MKERLKITKEHSNSQVENKLTNPYHKKKKYEEKRIHNIKNKSNKSLIKNPGGISLAPKIKNILFHICHQSVTSVHITRYQRVTFEVKRT